jgi:hypothetical protein
LAIILIHIITADQVKEDDVGVACCTHGRGEKMYKVLMGKPEEKRPLGRPRSRWDQNGSWGDWLWECGMDSNGSGSGPVAGCCAYGDELSCSGDRELVSKLVN